MKTFTPEELKEIIRKHQLWLTDEADGERADLSSADLSSADLSSADLSSANLSSANLRYADLRYADLRSANLSEIRGMPDVSKIDDFVLTLAKRALEPNALCMSEWHTCDTTHCLAGWAITLHPEGKILEHFLDTPLAGYLIVPELWPLFYEVEGDEKVRRILTRIVDGMSAKEAIEVDAVSV